MPTPEWGDHKPEVPTTDNQYFEVMSRIIFVSGLNWATLQKKWPGIKAAFADFDIAAVAEFDEAKLDALMQDPEVIRNLPKMRAVVTNAAKMGELVREHGSFGAYLDSLGGEAALLEGIRRNFGFMGKGTSVTFLHAVGRDLPAATKQWREHR